MGCRAPASSGGGRSERCGPPTQNNTPLFGRTGGANRSIRGGSALAHTLLVADTVALNLAAPRRRFRAPQGPPPCFSCSPKARESRIGASRSATAPSARRRIALGAAAFTAAEQAAERRRDGARRGLCTNFSISPPRAVR